MKVIESTATLLRPQDEKGGLIALRIIEAMARISHHSEAAQTEDSWRPFLKANVIQHGDWSVTEHASASVLFRVDRGITHELVRHRHFSYTQESTRFVRGARSYPDGLEFIQPVELSGTRPVLSFQILCRDAEEIYTNLLNAKVRPQEARAVLPNALASTIGMTGNFRSWRWFFLARTTEETHPDMRRVTEPLLEVFKQRIPLLYDDIVPGEKQSIAMAKAH